MNPDLSKFDVEELFHLALAASKNGQSDQCIFYLKATLERPGEHSKAHYLLGAEYAQIGMYDRAIEEIKNAVSLNPTLYSAHFQLGLLYLTCGRAEEAISAWQALDNIDASEPYYLFKTGLEYLIKDDFVQCKSYLTKGMAENISNPSLNNDMQMIMEQIAKQTEGTTSLANDATGETSEHVFLSAYKSPKN